MRRRSRIACVQLGSFATKPRPPRLTRAGCARERRAVGQGLDSLPAYFSSSRTESQKSHRGARKSRRTPTRCQPYSRFGFENARRTSSARSRWTPPSAAHGLRSERSVCPASIESLARAPRRGGRFVLSHRALRSDRTRRVPHVRGNILCLNLLRRHIAGEDAVDSVDFASCDP